MTKAAAQVQKAFVKGDTKKMEWSGVAWLANESNTVVCFKSWSDAGTVYGGLKYHHKYHGVPFTQEDLDIHYPELKQYTGLTKAKIGSAKVGFQDVRSPLAVQHRGHTYIVPPLFPTDIWMRLPKSMLNPTLTAEQQKYLDTHEMNTQILLKTEIVLYHVGIEHAIAKAKHIEKQGYRVELQKYAPIGGRPLYTVLKVLTNLKAAEPKTTAAARKTTKKTVAKPANVSKIERALSKLKPLDVKERELKVEERQLRMSQAIGQESPAYHRLLDKIIGIQAKKAKIWNTELRGMVIPETGKTMWQMAIASPTLPVKLHGQETLLHFNVPELLAAVETHKRKPAPAPNLPPILTAPPELTADVLGTGPMGLTPTPTTKPKRKPAARTKRKQPAKAALTEKEIIEIMRAAGEAQFKSSGSCGNFDDWNATGSMEFKYPHEIKIGNTIYRWHVSESHRRGRSLTTSRELWVVGGTIPGRTKFSVGTHLTRAHLHRIVKIIHDDRKRQARHAAAVKKQPTRKPKTKVAAAPKAKPKATKPKAKKTAAAQKLTATQREYLAIQGFVMVRRGGKYVKITG